MSGLLHTLAVLSTVPIELDSEWSPEYYFVTLGSLFRGILFTCCIQLLLYSSNLSKIGVIFNSFTICTFVLYKFNHLNPEFNPICHLLALLVAHHILHVSRITNIDIDVYMIPYNWEF